jgi:hypothetical protein
MSRQTLVLLALFFFAVPCCLQPRGVWVQFYRLALLSPGTQERYRWHTWGRGGNVTMAFPAYQLAGRGGS